jgi:hypothetical protein
LSELRENSAFKPMWTLLMLSFPFCGVFWF